MDIAQIANDANVAENLMQDKVQNPKATLNKYDFLKLLVAQLKYQDPLHPLNNDQFIQENTMFSQLEQLMNMSKSISQLKTNLTPNGKEFAASYLGKYISTGENTIHVSKTNIDSVSFALSKDAEVTVHISNSKGEDIADVDLGKLSQGPHQFKWNGKDNQGNSVPIGNYTVRIVAKYDDGSQVTLSKSAGKVIAIRFEGDQTILVTDSGKNIPLSQVQSVAEGGKS